MTNADKLTEFLDEQIEKSKKYCNSRWASLFMEIKRVVEKFAILQEYNVIVEKKLEPLINQREKLVSRLPNDDFIEKLINIFDKYNSDIPEPILNEIRRLLQGRGE